MSLRLTVATPSKPVIKKEIVEFVDIPTVKGYVGILPGHTALISILDTGILRYGKTRDDVSKIAIDRGFLEVSADEVTVIADAVYKPGEVNRASLEELLRASEKTIMTEKDPAAVASAMRDKKRALCILEMET